MVSDSLERNESEILRGITRIKITPKNTTVIIDKKSSIAGKGALII
jgi:hypothetical protein